MTKVRKFLQEYNPSHKTEYFTLFLAVIFHIALIPLNIYGIFEEYRLLNSIISSALLTITILIIFIRKSRNDDARSDVLLKRIADIQSTVTVSSGVECINYSRFINEDIEEKIGRARTVKNTFISFSKRRTNIEVRNEKIIDVYERFFTGKGKIWIDLVGINELFSGRHEAIFSRFRKSKRFRRSPGPSHTIHVVPSKFPMINYIIIYYDDDTDCEVVFGWIYDDESEGADVFRTRNPEIVSLFERHFRLLRSYSHKPPVVLRYTDQERPEKQFQNLDIIDREGLWFVVGGRWTSDHSKQCECNSGNNYKFSVEALSLLMMQFGDHDIEIGETILWGDNGKKGMRIQTTKYNVERSVSDNKRIFAELGGEGKLADGIRAFTFLRQGKHELLDARYHSEDPELRPVMYGIKLDLPTVDYPFRSFEMASKRLKDLVSAHGLSEAVTEDSKLLLEKAGEKLASGPSFLTSKFR